MRHSILAACFPKAGEDDARNLVGSQIQHVVELAVEDILPRLPRYQEIQVASIGVAEPVTVVDQSLDPDVAAEPGVCGQKRALRDSQHCIPAGDVIEGADDLGSAELQMVQIDISATPVALQIFPSPVLGQMAGSALFLRTAAVRAPAPILVRSPEG